MQIDSSVINKAKGLAKGDASSITEFVQLLVEFFNFAVQTEKIQPLLFKIRESQSNSKERILLTRDLINQVIDLTMKPTYSKLLSPIEEMHNIVKPLGRHIEPLDSYDHNSLHNILTHVASTYTWEDVCRLLKGRQVLDRLEKDYPEDKKIIADRVVERMVNSKTKVKVFIQSSTTAIFLADALRKKTIDSQSLVVTNSSILPLLLLPNSTRYCVHVFCSSIFDEVSGGWNTTSNDLAAMSYLDDLFGRTHDPLDTAILTPMEMTVEDGPCFANNSAELAHKLFNISKNIIIMIVAARVYANHSGHGNSTQVVEAAVPKDMWKNLKSLNKNIKVVVAGSHTCQIRERITSQLIENGVNEVHWHPTGIINDDGTVENVVFRKWIVNNTAE